MKGQEDVREAEDTAGIRDGIKRNVELREDRKEKRKKKPNCPEINWNRAGS